jgi:hypothetical protein
MKIVVRGLVALALLIVGDTAHGFTFTATGPGDNTSKMLDASATFVVPDLKLVITLPNTANDQSRPCQMTIRSKGFARKAVELSIGKQNLK